MTKINKNLYIHIFVREELYHPYSITKNGERYRIKEIKCGFENKCKYHNYDMMERRFCKKFLLFSKDFTFDKLCDGAYEEGDNKYDPIGVYCLMPYKSYKEALAKSIVYDILNM